MDNIEEIKVSLHATGYRVIEQLRARDRQVESLRGVVKSQERTISILNGENQQLKSQIKDLEATLSELKPAAIVGNSFSDDLTNLMNRHGLSSATDTPAYVLARFVCDTIEAFNKATDERDKWEKS